MVAVPIQHETRVFVGVRDRAAERALLLNPVGPPADAGTAEALFEAVLGELERPPDGSPRWLVCCGSLLPGLPTDFYGRLGMAARDRGWSFAPDCDGEALRLASSSADLLVPNVHEAERLLGRRIVGLEQAAEAAATLLERGAAMAVVTMGSDGAVAATRNGCWHARLRAADSEPGLGRVLDEGSAVGAGDAFLAGLLVAGFTSGAAPPERPGPTLRAAVAAGTAALLSRGSDLVRASDVERVLPHVAVDVIPG
jgi:fructose-1-phosphate kinase PfkB-like protein